MLQQIDTSSLVYLEITIKGKTYEGYFTKQRVDRSLSNKRLKMFDIRLSDDKKSICELKNHVMVNHAGTFLTKRLIREDTRKGVPIDSYIFKKQCPNKLKCKGTQHIVENNEKQTPCSQYYRCPFTACYAY